MKSIVHTCITLQRCHIGAIASGTTGNSIVGSAYCLGPHQWKQYSSKLMTKSLNIAPLCQVGNRGIPFPCNWGYCYLSLIGKVYILPCTPMTYALQVNVASDLILRSELWCVWQFQCVYVDQLLLCEYIKGVGAFFCQCVLLTIKIQYMRFIILLKQAAQVVKIFSSGRLVYSAFAAPWVLLSLQGDGILARIIFTNFSGTFYCQCNKD